MPGMPPAETAIVVRDGPRVVGLDTLAPGGAVLHMSMGMVVGQWVVLDVQHPTFPAPLVAPARVGWSRAAQDGSALVAFELHGTWERLAIVRRSLLGILASRALSGERLVGWVLRDPDGTWACHSVHTVKVAVLSPQTGGRVIVRRRDDGSTWEAPSLLDGVAMAYGLDAPPRMDPPLPEDAAPSEAELFAAGTIVVGPERAPVPTRSPLPDETIAVRPAPFGGEPARAGRPAKKGAPPPPPPPPAPPRPAAKGASSVMKDPHASSGFRRPQRPTTGRHTDYSQILAGENTVGWLGPTSEGSWTAYDLEGAKVAVIMAQGADGFRLCWFGDKATESLEFLDAPTCLEALAAAFELDRLPRVDPPLPGVS